MKVIDAVATKAMVEAGWAVEVGYVDKNERLRIRLQAAMDAAPESPLIKELEAVCRKIEHEIYLMRGILRELRFRLSSDDNSLIVADAKEEIFNELRAILDKYREET